MLADSPLAKRLKERGSRIDPRPQDQNGTSGAGGAAEDDPVPSTAHVTIPYSLLFCWRGHRGQVGQFALKVPALKHLLMLTDALFVSVLWDLMELRLLLMWRRVWPVNLRYCLL